MTMSGIFLHSFFTVRFRKLLFCRSAVLQYKKASKTLLQELRLRVSAGTKARLDSELLYVLSYAGWSAVGGW
jgi:hypothetical protein